MYVKQRKLGEEIISEISFPGTLRGFHLRTTGGVR